MYFGSIGSTSSAKIVPTELNFFSRNLTHTKPLPSVCSLCSVVDVPKFLKPNLTTEYTENTENENCFFPSLHTVQVDLLDSLGLTKKRYQYDAPHTLLIRIFMRILFTLFLAGSLFTAASLHAQPRDDVRDLIVLYNYRATVDPATAERILSDVQRANSSGIPNALFTRLRSPRAARLLITMNRLNATRRTRLRENDPEEVLHRYVVLSYANPAEASLVRQLLRVDPNVVWVEKDRAGWFSTSDTYIGPGVDTTQYQWGLHELNLPVAWNNVRGHAYIGVADNGIQKNTRHPDVGTYDNFFSPGNYRPLFDADFTEGDNTVDELSDGRIFAGHGTHVAGIIAATTNNGMGAAGVCWNCSLIVTRVSPRRDGSGDSTVANGIYWSVRNGAQAMNFSFGLPQRDCNSTPTDVVCMAIAFANSRDVILVGAGGNDRDATIQFPASDWRVLPVAGVQKDTPGPGTGGLARWDENFFYDGVWAGSSQFQHFFDSQRGVAAPARNVVSTFYTGSAWNSDHPWRCTDAKGALLPELGYDDCTGTSMAAPHITGLVGLLRSINPLRPENQIRDLILNSANPQGLFWGYVGRGIPDANAAVNAALASTNRLTPLFAFTSSTLANNFYTTWPQMAVAASYGDLLPQNPPIGQLYLYTSEQIASSPIDEYLSFPSGVDQPRAMVWIFTTHVNPLGGAELVPLYRLSWKCGDYTPDPPPICNTNPRHVSHVYVVPQEINAYQGAGYKVDGIEGYVYSREFPQPPGTEALYRQYHPGLDAYVLFPESLRAYFEGLGYTEQTPILGYAYRNHGSRPTY